LSGLQISRDIVVTSLLSFLLSPPELDRDIAHRVTPDITPLDIRFVYTFVSLCIVAMIKMARLSLRAFAFHSLLPALVGAQGIVYVTDLTIYTSLVRFLAIPMGSANTDLPS
jgi:hypothetical protein